MRLDRWVLLVDAYEVTGHLRIRITRPAEAASQPSDPAGHSLHSRLITFELVTTLPMSASLSSTPVSRRSFLRNLSLTTATTMALSSAGPFVRAADKAGRRPIIVGTGEHQYEVVHDWGRLPVSCVLGNTHGVVEDSQGRIYVKHTVGKGSVCSDAVLVFDAEGNLITSWGQDFKGGAHGLHLAREGREEFLYLTDPARHLVVKTTLEGEELWRADASACIDFYPDGNSFRPTNVATAPDGTVFVADGYGAGYIHRFDSRGNYQSSFGGPGSGPGNFNCPHGLMVDTRGSEPELVVADRGNRRLQYFDLDGRHRRFVTEELRAPCHFAEHKGVLLIPDLEARVTLFDRQNRLIAHLGDGGHYQGVRDKTRDLFPPGKFVAPHGACFDHAGNIFVVEWVEVGRITKLRKIA